MPHERDIVDIVLGETSAGLSFHFPTPEVVNQTNGLKTQRQMSRMVKVQAEVWSKCSHATFLHVFNYAVKMIRFDVNRSKTAKKKKTRILLICVFSQTFEKLEEKK